MHDEIAHMGVINGLLGLGLPGRLCALIIGVDTDDIEVLKVAEFERVKLFNSPPNTR